LQFETPTEEFDECVALIGRDGSGNRVSKDGFYYQCDLLADTTGAMRFELKKGLKICNTYRPHKLLGGLTPMAYIQNI